jgi:hypothetical protein
MRERSRLGTVVVAVAAAAMMAMGVLPAAAAAPQPLLPVEGPSEVPVFDPLEQARICQGGSPPSPSGGLTLTLGASTSTERASYPGPVIQVPDSGDDPGEGEVEEPPVEEPPPVDCSTSLSLGLVIESPDGRKPEQSNAYLDDRTIPQAVLEAGFSADLPSQDHRVTMPDPLGDWKLIGVRCGCLGPSAQAATMAADLRSSPIGWGQLTSYPGPVIQVGGSCSSSAASPSAAASDGRITATPLRMTQAVYPGPVFRVPPEDPEEPPPPRPAVLSWNSVGTVTISDPDGVGGIFDCVWTVEEDLLVPRAGPWRANNRRGLLDCGAFRQRIAAGPVERGRLGVEEDGRRLIMDGPRADSLDFEVQRDREDPRLYTGRARLPIPGGGRIDFTVTLDLVSAERMDGILRATAMIQGRRCDVRRPFVLRYAGGG